jgi:hypothetical protein
MDVQEMNRPRVFFINEPLRFDKDEKRLVPFYNIKPASEFGDINIVIPGRPPHDPEASLRMMRAALNDFSPEDYLAVAGDLHLVAWAAVIAARAQGMDKPLQLLKWDNRYMKYIKFSGTP